MYNSNSDVYISQPWSQLDTQDWNTHISNSQEFNQNVPSTPARHVLPPTPSTSGIQSNHPLSNSWSRRVNSQMTPQSQTNSTPRGFVRETIFSREIRFALQTVLTVVKELPEKLREVISKLAENKGRLDDEFINKIKQIVDSKIPHLDALLLFIERSDLFAADNKKSIGSFRNEMEEFKKIIGVQSTNISSLSGNQDQNYESLRKQVILLRKSYASESRKIQNLIEETHSKNISRGRLDLRYENALQDLQILTKKSTDFGEKILLILEDNKSKEMGMLNTVLDEILSIKKCLQNLPFLINSSVKEALKENSIVQTSTLKQNVRVAPLTSPFPANLRPSCSPVARVMPQQKENIFPNQFLRDSTNELKKAKIQKSFLDMIDLGNSSEDSTDSDSLYVVTKEIIKRNEAMKRSFRRLSAERKTMCSSHPLNAEIKHTYMQSSKVPNTKLVRMAPVSPMNADQPDVRVTPYQNTNKNFIGNCNSDIGGFTCISRQTTKTRSFL